MREGKLEKEEGKYRSFSKNEGLSRKEKKNSWESDDVMKGWIKS